MSPNELFEFLKSRRSIRLYTEQKPDRAMVEKLIAAACQAPSNHNRQGWKFLVFEDREEIKRLANSARENVRARAERRGEHKPAWAEEILKYVGGFETAPLLILVMHKSGPAMGRSLLTEASGEWASGEAISAAMAVENLLLMAHVLGLGACIMTAPLLAGEMWLSLPDLPPGFIPTCVVAVGYPAEDPLPPPKKNLQHVVEYRSSLP
jgi:coenzyme F420-0:L-glutamate ligase / coenzyme F420-1:gamma-L-glutamate ligase